MRIVRVNPIVVNGGNANWVFVEVHTDEGITGLGEATLLGRAATLAAAIEDMAHYVIGRDPLQIERLWQAMYRYDRFRGGAIQCSAISAVDIALWDILGQSCGLPIYQLLGGASRDRVQLYGKLGDDDPGEAPRQAVALVERGYRAMKLGPSAGDNGVVDDHDVGRRLAESVGAIRAAVGDEVEILIDLHGRFGPAATVEIAERVGELRPYFLEEPVPLEDWDGLAQVAARTNVPLATGERLHTKYGFGRLIEQGAVRFVQPDVCQVGGITELKKIAAMAEARNIRVAPHNPSSHSEVSTMASVHVDAAIPNFAIQEHPAAQPPWRYDLFEGGVEVAGGCAELPARPGLGLRLDRRIAEAHPYEPRRRVEYRRVDGSVAET